VVWLINYMLFNFFLVHKLQDLESRQKHKSFLLEVAYYWARMTLEQTHEEDDVEADDGK
jgi:hypothetical protein